MRPSSWLNNNTRRRHRQSREPNSGVGTGHPELLSQSDTIMIHHEGNNYTGLYSPPPMHSPQLVGPGPLILHHNYSAHDQDRLNQYPFPTFAIQPHMSPAGYPHASPAGVPHVSPARHPQVGPAEQPHAPGGNYPRFDFENRASTPHGPSLLGTSGPYGLRPDAIPFDPSSPDAAPPTTTLPATSASPTSGIFCLDECGDDCPFKDPYLRGWLKHNAKKQDTPLEFLQHSGKGATLLQPGWLERMGNQRSKYQETAGTSLTKSPPVMGSDQTRWEDYHSMRLRGGLLSDFHDLEEHVDSRNSTFSRSSTPAFSDQRSSTSRFFPRGLSNKSISIPRSSTLSIVGQNLPTSQLHDAFTNTQHGIAHPDPDTTSLPFRRLQNANGDSSENLNFVQQAYKRVEEAKRVSRLMDSPCSSSNNSQPSSWSLEDVSNDIQPEDSCSVFISDLPKDLTLSKLLGSIRGYGRIRYAKTSTCGALVVFFERDAAQRLAREGRLAVGDSQGKVSLAKQRIAQSSLPREFSRVLVITGFIGGLSMAFLKETFDMKNIRYELDKITRGAPGDMFALQFHFASHSQAAQIKEMIANEPFFRKKAAKVRYGIDPCAEPSAADSQEE
ncbi:hypothetical protein QBC41DRAFT_237741 [Cercophora samala]|uniref:RRM domain-containing protein n=1 Tax=Cercophora samala TaxID=330535 RepID=A0AA40D209_9PEZI|nr:hypothetical protein QBC41DRAFT_237741 [Cercophora samala]